MQCTSDMESKNWLTQTMEALKHHVIPLGVEGVRAKMGMLQGIWWCNAWMLSNCHKVRLELDIMDVSQTLWEMLMIWMCHRQCKKFDNIDISRSMICPELEEHHEEFWCKYLWHGKQISINLT